MVNQRNLRLLVEFEELEPSELWLYHSLNCLRNIYSGRDHETGIKRTYVYFCF